MGSFKKNGSLPAFSIVEDSLIQLNTENPNAKFDQALRLVLGPVFRNQPNTGCIKHDVGTGSNVTSQISQPSNSGSALTSGLRSIPVKLLWNTTINMMNISTGVLKQSDFRDICDLESEDRGRCPAKVWCLLQLTSESVHIIFNWNMPRCPVQKQAKKDKKRQHGKSNFGASSKLTLWPEK